MLISYGWDDARARAFAPYAVAGLVPGRVIVQQRGLSRIITEAGECPATLAGRFVHEAAAGEHPVAGDWVAAALRPGEDAATIHAVLPRTSAFRRQGPNGVQVAAANVDVALLVTSLNGDLNPRRLERYLAVARESGIAPVIVLTKADACADAPAALARVMPIAGGAPIHAISALTGAGLEDVAAHLAPGRTAALLGSSGVGKSTLLNALLGAEHMTTRAISGDDKRGRHTTTHRELVRLASGALILDSPGMRELGVGGADLGVDATFADIQALFGACRFSDCAHGSEPGCAVRAALEAGDLDDARWRSYQKLKRELAHEARKDDPRARAEARQIWIKRARANRADRRRAGEDE
jgi:ribosome biogenesis GTPase